MSYNIILMVIIGWSIFFNAGFVTADTIELKDNRVLKVDCHWEKNGNIFYEKHGTVISLEKSKIRKIIDDSSSVPKILYEAENEKNINELKQSKKEIINSKRPESIVESLLVENKSTFPPAHDSKSNATKLHNNSVHRDAYGRPVYDRSGRLRYDSYGRPLSYEKSQLKPDDPNSDRQIYKGFYRPYSNRKVYKD